jgi:hypothetical protein
MSVNETDSKVPPPHKNGGGGTRLMKIETF